MVVDELKISLVFITPRMSEMTHESLQKQVTEKSTSPVGGGTYFPRGSIHFGIKSPFQHSGNVCRSPLFL